MVLRNVLGICFRSGYCWFNDTSSFPGVIACTRQSSAVLKINGKSIGDDWIDGRWWGWGRLIEGGKVENTQEEKTNFYFHGLSYIVQGLSSTSMLSLMQPLSLWSLLLLSRSSKECYSLPLVDCEQLRRRTELVGETVIYDWHRQPSSSKNHYSIW